MSENDLNINIQNVDNITVNPENYNEQQTPLINNNNNFNDNNNFRPQISNNENNLPQQQNPNEIQVISNMNPAPNNLNNPQITNNQTIQNNTRQIQIAEPYMNPDYYEPIIPNNYNNQNIPINQYPNDNIQNINTLTHNEIYYNSLYNYHNEIGYRPNGGAFNRYNNMNNINANRNRQIERGPNECDQCLCNCLKAIGIVCLIACIIIVGFYIFLIYALSGMN